MNLAECKVIIGKLISEKLSQCTFLYAQFYPIYIKIPHKDYTHHQTISVLHFAKYAFTPTILEEKCTTSLSLHHANARFETASCDQITLYLISA